MSSAYIVLCAVNLPRGGGVGRSERYMLYSVGERIAPCGTPAANWKGIPMSLKILQEAVLLSR